MNLALKGRRIVSLQTPSHCGAYAEPFQGKANLSTIPRASLRCALGWYADAPSALKKPIIFLGERADHGPTIRRFRESVLFPSGSPTRNRARNQRSGARNRSASGFRIPDAPGVPSSRRARNGEIPIIRQTAVDYEHDYERDYDFRNPGLSDPLLPGNNTITRRGTRSGEWTGWNPDLFSRGGAEAQRVRNG